MFQLLTVLINCQHVVNQIATEYIAKQKIFCCCSSVLAQSSLYFSNNVFINFTYKTPLYMKFVHLRSPHPRWAASSLSLGRGCDWCPRRWRPPLLSPCQLWSDQGHLHNREIYNTKINLASLLWTLAIILPLFSAILRALNEEKMSLWHQWLVLRHFVQTLLLNFSTKT